MKDYGYGRKSSSRLDTSAGVVWSSTTSAMVMAANRMRIHHKERMEERSGSSETCMPSEDAV